MRTSQKGFIAPLLLALIAVLILGGGAYVYVQNNQSNQPITATSTAQTAGWHTYTDTVFGFSFTYPNVLTETIHGANVVLTHKVPYPHADVCDMKGDSQPLDAITDFDLALQVVSSGLKETIQQNENGIFVAETFSGSKVKIIPGLLDEVTIGSMHGYKVTKGAEGCGVYTYYFPLSDGRTLYGYRPFVTEFSPVLTNYKTYLAVPGIIPPTQEESYVNSIFASFKLLP